jgi:hypothetical protein
LRCAFCIVLVPTLAGSVAQVGIVTKETGDFTPVFFALAGLATFAVVIVLVFLRPRWYRIN